VLAWPRYAVTVVRDHVDNDADAKDDLTTRFENVSSMATSSSYRPHHISGRRESPNIGSLLRVRARGRYDNDTEREGLPSRSGLCSGSAAQQCSLASYPEGYGKAADEAIHNIEHGMKVFATTVLHRSGVCLASPKAPRGWTRPTTWLGSTSTPALQVPKSMLRGGDDLRHRRAHRRRIAVARTCCATSASLAHLLLEVKESEGPWVDPQHNPLATSCYPASRQDRWNAS